MVINMVPNVLYVLKIERLFPLHLLWNLYKYSLMNKYSQIIFHIYICYLFGVKNKLSFLILWVLFEFFGWMRDVQIHCYIFLEQLIYLVCFWLLSRYKKDFILTFDHLWKINWVIVDMCNGNHTQGKPFPSWRNFIDRLTLG